MPARLILVVLAFAMVVACRPSKAEVAALHQKLDTLSAEQEKLNQRVTAWEEERGRQQELDQAGRWRSEEADVKIAERIEGLETRLEGLDRPKPNRDAIRPGRPDPAQRYKVLVGSAHTKGSRSALVTVVMWLDYQCPFCARVQPTLDQLEREYQGKVRFVFKHNPLPMHPRAMPAALAAESAGKQGKFWRMSKLLWEHTRELTDERFMKLARKLKLNRSKFKSDMASLALKKRIEEQQQQGVKLGARGTPAFFVNGRFLSGAQPREAFKHLIDEELAKAKKLTASGISKRRVYEELMDGALEKP